MKDYSELLADIGHKPGVEISIYSDNKRTKKQAYILATDIMFMFGELEYETKYYEEGHTLWVKLDAQNKHEGIRVDVFYRKDVDATK